MEYDLENECEDVGAPFEGRAEGMSRKTAADLLQRQLFARSERVKGIDFHPVEPWILTTLYSGMLWRKELEGRVLMQGHRSCLHLELRDSGKPLHF